MRIIFYCQTSAEYDTVSNFLGYIMGRNGSVFNFNVGMDREKNVGQHIT